jgi:DNA-binding transcriptional LysR family regulator
VQIRSSHLRYLIAVAEEGQITRAAARLHVAQPALSQAIARLEADLGLQLFERHSRGMRLTLAGETVVAMARRAIDAEEDAIQTAQTLARADRGEVEFGFVGAPPGFDTPGALGRFAREHPENFIGYHASVDPDWAGFWSLDGHRGGPPERVTPDQVLAPQEVFGALAVRDAITTVPSSSAALLVQHVPGIRAVPIPGAEPTVFVLAGRRDRRTAPVERFVAFAREDIKRAAADGRAA